MENEPPKLWLQLRNRIHSFPKAFERSRRAEHLGVHVTCDLG